MTKEELLNKKFSIADFGERKDALYFSDLMSLFESNVVIPKGATLQYYDGIQCKWIDKINIYEGTEYRIKPSEPVYEWQWYFISDGLAEIVNYGEFLTDEEAQFHCVTGKLEETKRERKQ